VQNQAPVATKSLLKSRTGACISVQWSLPAGPTSNRVRSSSSGTDASMLRTNRVRDWDAPAGICPTRLRSSAAGGGGSIDCMPAPPCEACAAAAAAACWPMSCMPNRSSSDRALAAGGRPYGGKRWARGGSEGTLICGSCS
jgi:hypothetical protein